jgi:hypothetical protein
MPWLIFATMVCAWIANAQDKNAIAALEEFGNMCESQGQAIWEHSLCGPMMLVDPATRAVIANHGDTGNRFRHDGALFTGPFPEPFTPSNTAIHWDGQEWSTVMLPLPLDPFRRLALISHEAFHRIQPGLGLTGSDTPNEHLDTEDGRIWLRLELRAMAQALRMQDAIARRAAADAMLFRMYRHSLFHGSAEREAAMERQEGLAEYTGAFAALKTTGESVNREARIVESFEDSDAMARSFAYATGPALGLLLDRFTQGWRARVAHTPMDAMLIWALKVPTPADLKHTAEERAAFYGYPAVVRAEQEREQRRHDLVSELTVKFMQGPVLDFPSSPEMYRNFNPMALTPFPPHGTYYPTGTFTAPWGKLQVDSGGALLTPDNRAVRVPVPSNFHPSESSGAVVQGDGWALHLSNEWKIIPARNRGSFLVVRAEP